MSWRIRLQFSGPWFYTPGVYMNKRYSKEELEAFRTFYQSFQKVNCDDCLDKADAALRKVQKYFTAEDIGLMIVERSRIEAMSLSEQVGRAKIIRVMMPILKRLGLGLDDLS